MLIMPSEIMGRGRITILHFSWGISTDLTAGARLSKTAAAIWWAIRRVEPKWCWTRLNYPTVALSAKDLRSHQLYILQWSSGPICESLIQRWWTAAYSAMPLAFEQLYRGLQQLEGHCWYIWVFFKIYTRCCTPISGLEYRQRHILICKQVASSI